MRLSGNIRAFRKERALTQEQLAQALGVTAGAVYKWEAGLSAPDISLIIELAELFDISVDVLLGCETHGGSQTAAARLKDFLHRKDENGLSEADRLLPRYPNCFAVVYGSAELYRLFGFMRRDQKLLLRSVELMEHARLLLSQNADPKISEVSINHEIAKAYAAMGENEKAVELFMRCNPRGVNDDFIGYILGLCGSGEAVPYLSEALLHCISSLTRVVIGYFQVYYRQKNYPAAAGAVRLGLRFFSDLKRPGQNSYLDKTSAKLSVDLAAAQLGLGDSDGARESLRTALKLAERFDQAADYNGDSIRFVSAGKPMTAFDDMGVTAMDCIASQVETYGNKTLTELWEEIRKGGADE